MSTPQTQTAPTSPAVPATAVPMALESTTLPVADVDRAKAFYMGLGWRLDADFDFGDRRVVQFTPPQSPASIQFGVPLTATPGSAQGLLLVVADVVAARDELRGHGVDVSEIWHNTAPADGMEPGVDPERRSYFSWASFTDPDGNGWLLQEITERAPGREW